MNKHKHLPFTTSPAKRRANFSSGSRSLEVRGFWLELACLTRSDSEPGVPVAGKDHPIKINELHRLFGDMRKAKVYKFLDELVQSGAVVINGDTLVLPLLAEWMGRPDRPSISKRIRQSIFERDGERCRYCGSTGGPFQIDHIHPVALGGDNNPENLTVACVTCNSSKHAKPLHVWCQ